MAVDVCDEGCSTQVVRLEMKWWESLERKAKGGGVPIMRGKVQVADGLQKDMVDLKS